MREYEYVVAIAEEKSLAKAAERLYISSSALSQFISKLEANIGNQLFERQKHGWVPTPAGEVYISYAYNILNTERDMISNLNTFNNTSQDTINIGLLHGFTAKMFSKTMSQFKKRFPNVKLIITESIVQTITQGVKSGQFDIAFLASAKAPEGIKTLEISTDTLVVAVPSDSLAAKKYWLQGSNTLPVMPLEELKSLSFIRQAEGTTLRQAQDFLFREAGFVPNTMIESTNVDTSASLVEGGYCAAILPSSYITDSPEVKYFNINTNLRWHRYLTTRVGHKLTAAEEYLLTLCKEAANN